MRISKILLLLLLFLLFSGSSQKTVYGSDNKVVQVVDDQLDYQLFLPWVRVSDPFANQTGSIWAHASLPQPHEVALFRKEFIVNSEVDTPTLTIFADTRYEIWVDGEWVGRGPARFLQQYHEYDRYVLPDLPPGKHLVAVLVQWSPNNRRAESATPFLRLALNGIVGTTQRQILRSNSTWKVRLSPAWQQNASLIHAWGLIGSSELLDLRILPAKWMQPGFSDARWPFAVEVDPTQTHVQLAAGLFDVMTHSMWELPQQISSPDRETVIYEPRSIQALDRVIVAPSLIDRGTLSPEKTLVELLPGGSEPYILPFQATETTPFQVEMLRADSLPMPDAISLDGVGLSWFAVGSQRPDVYAASLDVAAGHHELRIQGIPIQGATLLLPKEKIIWEATPFTQGLHAGRRLLLPAYKSDFTSNVQFESMDEGLVLPELPAYLLLDLGRTVHGRIQLTVSGPAGTVVDMGWDERLTGNPARTLPFPGSLHPQWNQVDSWILDGSHRMISTIDARSGRYILIAAWGQGPVVFEKIQVIEERYPLSQRGWFESDNALLNQIWQTGVDSALVNMTDAFTDTPWRERGQWWGDAYVIDHVNRVSLGDTDLLRRGLLLMAKSFAPDGRPVGLAPHGAGAHLNDYGMLWLHSLQEYLAQTGDRYFVKEHYPTILQFMMYLEKLRNPSTGLLDLPYGHWSGNAYIDTNGFQSRFGQSAAVNAMYIETLERASEIASALGDQTQASTWQTDASEVKEAMFSNLYLAGERRYITRIFNGVVYPPTAHAQAWPLAYEVILPGEEEAVVSALLELLSTDPQRPTINAYGMYWLLEALAQHGYISEALDLIEIFYGYMLDQGAKTWWEHFNANQYQSASLSHGWGGAPTWFLSTYVLGARQVGATSWVVQPAFEGVNMASGQIPIQDGALQVYWDHPSCQEQNLRLTSPEGTSGQVILSIDSLVQITLNGNLIWQNGILYADDLKMMPDGLHLLLGEGDFWIHLQRDCE